MAIIRSGSNVGELAVSASGRAKTDSVLYDSNGNPIRVLNRTINSVSLSELGINSYDNPDIIYNVINISSPLSYTSYTSPTVRACIDGYDAITWVCKVSGTGFSAVMAKIEWSLDNVNWQEWHDFYIISPQNSVMCTLGVECRSSAPYMRLKLTTEYNPPTASIVVDVIRSVKSSNVNPRHPISMSFYGNGNYVENPHARGIYETEWCGASVNSANYIYFAMLVNPSYPGNIRLTRMDYWTVALAGSNKTNTGMHMQLCKINSLSGGTPITPSPQISSRFPACGTDIATVVSGGPTVNVVDVFYALPISTVVGEMVNYDEDMTNTTAIQLVGGEGVALRAPVAISNANDTISFRLIWRVRY